MDHKTMNTGAEAVMGDRMTQAGGNGTMNGTMPNNGGGTTMNGTMPNNGGSRAMNGRMTKTGTGIGIGQGVLWLGATAIAIVGAKYAWQRARQSLRSTNPKYLETAERMIDSVVDGSITN